MIATLRFHHTLVTISIIISEVRMNTAENSGNKKLFINFILKLLLCMCVCMYDVRERCNHIPHHSYEAEDNCGVNVNTEGLTELWI